MPDSPALLNAERLDLLRATPEHLRALIEGGDRFEREFSIAVREGYLEFPEALGWALKHGEGNNWYLPYLYLLRGEGALVGMGGYKGPPDSDGVVEIGYGVAPAYRSRGLASESARALLAGAFALDEVATVRAHTLPERNASVGVLERCGFSYIGSVEDPDDGVVWRWERSR